jgi:hypothetical protein
MVLLVAGIAAALYPSTRGGMWKQRLPATAVIASTYLVDDTWPFAELRRRSSVDERRYWTRGEALSDWQWRWATDRCAAAISGSQHSPVKAAALILLLSNSPCPRRAHDALAKAVNDPDPKIAQQAAWGIKGARYDLHPLPESLQAALQKAARQGPDSTHGFNWPQLTIAAFNAIPPQWTRAQPRTTAPDPTDLVARLSGAFSHDLATVHHELGVQSRTLTWAYNGESGPFRVSRIDLEIDGQPGEDCIVLIGDSSGSHWHALVFAHTGEAWRLVTWLDLPNSPRAAPQFRSESHAGALWLVVTQLAGHGSDYQLWRDAWISCAHRHISTVLQTHVRGHGLSPSWERNWSLASEPPVITRERRRWLIEYPVEVTFTAGADLWTEVNGRTPPPTLFKRCGTLRYESRSRTGPFLPAASVDGSWEPAKLENMILGWPHEFVAENIGELLTLATSGSPEIRAWLAALLEQCTPTQHTEHLRETLAGRPSGP